MASILVLDTSKELLDFLCYSLTARNHHVHAVSTVDELKQQLEEHTPDLILLDVLLPGDNGRKLCGQLKRLAKLFWTPVIIMSDNPSYVEDFSSCKADDAIVKPFDLQAMLNKINRHLSSNRIFI